MEKRKRRGKQKLKNSAIKHRIAEENCGESCDIVNGSVCNECTEWASISVQRTFTRRSLMEWLGKATVLGLSGHVLTAWTAAGCETDDQPGEQTPFEDVSTECPDGMGFSFEPGGGDEPKWTERTVDEQNLKSILAKWTLKVDGLVENPIELNFAEILELARQDQVTDFHCVEGWSVLDVPWNGFHLATLFDLVKPNPSATHVNFYTWGSGYNESVPIDVVKEPKTILAYGVNCATLPLAHGFPLRLVIPRKYGYKNPKYVHQIEFTDSPISGYWVARGYPYGGNVAESRLRPGKY